MAFSLLVGVYFFMGEFFPGMMVFSDVTADETVCNQKKKQETFKRFPGQKKKTSSDRQYLT